MAHSIITHTGDGATVTYPIPFTLGILSRDDVTCRVGSEVDGLGAAVYRALTWITDSLVTIQGAAPGNGIPIVFTRTTSKTELQHDYTNGAAIEEGNLDESNLQSIMLIHEFLDGRISQLANNLNMGGYKITNMAEGTADTDAATVGQLGELYDSIDDFATVVASISDIQAIADITADIGIVADNIVDIQNAEENADAAATEAATATAQRILAEAAANVAQAAISGVKYRDAVVAATTANITLSGEQTIDTVAVTAGQRVLVKNQTSVPENGIYLCAAGAWSRATDNDAWTEIFGSAAPITGGSQADTTYICTSASTGTIGVDDITFVEWQTSILPGTVTNAMLADMAANTFKGNNTGSSDTPIDMTAAQAAAILPAFTGDSGSGGVKGLVPAPSTGDAAAHKRLSAAGTWLLAREKLTANRTYYVRTDGSDTNTGLSNTSGAAFLTIQQAVTTVLNTLDLGGYSVTISLGVAGTYAGATINSPLVGGHGSTLVISGDTGTPSSYIISSALVCTNNAVISVQGVDFTSSGYGLVAQRGGVIVISGNTIFGVCSSSHINATYGGVIYVAANYTIDGNSPQHLLAQYGSFIFCAAVTVTLTGTPAFASAFASVETCGTIQANGNTYSGAATGARYNASLNGIVNTLGGGATYFPGSLAGSTSTGGQYA